MQQHQKLPLSIIIIARNAAKDLPRCLETLAPHATEIIAVINDCSDDTRIILESFNARIIEHPWEGMTAQKNTALALATQPWVFNIDADEAPSAPLLNDIINIVKTDDPQLAGVSIPRLSFYMGRWIRHGDWYPDRVLRLFRREKGQFTGGKDHEKVTVTGLTQTIKSHLYHYSFPSLNAQILKMPFFGDVFLERLLTKNKHFSTLTAIFRAFWRFFRAYILKLGFLDGFPGFYIAYAQSFFTLYRYAKLFEYEQKQKTEKTN